MEYGGSGGSYLHETVITEEQVRAGVAAWGNQVHSQIVAPYILNYGTEEQKQHWLPKMASGEMVGAIAMTEPDTGSDLQSVKTTAVKDGDDYVINGSKTYITNGQNCGMVIVVAKTDPSQGAKGISLIVVETDNPGFKRGRNLKKLGQTAADTSEMFFEDCRVPQNQPLGRRRGTGFCPTDAATAPGTAQYRSGRRGRNGTRHWSDFRVCQTTQSVWSTRAGFSEQQVQAC